MTSSTAPSGTVPVIPGGTVAVQLGPPIPWYRRVPSLRRLVFFSIFVFLMAVGTLVGGFAYIQQVVQPLASSGVDGVGPGIFKQEEHGRVVFQDKERINILVLGIDYNYDSKGMLYTKSARSDTMMVVSLNREAGYLNVVSIPRDTQVLISEEFGYDKINSAYALGGVEQAIETVSEFLRVPIHHYVIVKVSGAKDIVEAIGGLPINVEKDMDYDDNWGHLHIHLKKGPQVLNGEQAVGYARFRMDEEGDRGRIRRQQQVIRALGQKLREPSILTRLPELGKIVKQNIETDLKLIEMGDLASLYSNFDFSKMRSGAIVGDDAEANGVSFIVPYAPENEKTVRRLLKDDNWIAKGDFRIQVLNGTPDAGAATRLADELNLEGLNVVDVGDADRATYAVTEIIEHRNLPRARGVMMSLLGGAKYRQAHSDKDSDYDLTIVVGSDRTRREAWTPPPQEYPVYRPAPYNPPPQPEPEPDLAPEDEVAPPPAPEPELEFEPELAPEPVSQPPEPAPIPDAVPIEVGPPPGAPPAAPPPPEATPIP